MSWGVMSERPLSRQVALVAGATRGAGRAIAVELARSGFYVYATGRSSRASGPRRWEGLKQSRTESSWRPRAELDRRSWSITKTPPRLPSSSRNRARPGPAGRLGQRHLRRRPVHGMGQAALGARLGGRTADARDGRAHASDHVSSSDPPDLAHRWRRPNPWACRRDDGRHL